MRHFNKPEIVELYELLSRRDALIIHFSGPKGGEEDSARLFPRDLMNVVSGGAQGGLSCCAISVGDDFDRHAWGTIGVVLGLQTRNSLVVASAHDVGSYEQEINGYLVRIFPNEKDISIADLEATFDERRDHNEWGIRNYSVLGIFAHPSSHEIYGLNLPQIKGIFPDQPLLTCKDGRLYRFENELIAVDHASIYPI
ncbi:MAG: hypothetical protein EWM45_11920 [Rhodopseudomonas palustris]|nr:MAG: hypothetical protein EWM45_11920 [Rhodopseudomonas palustris]